MGSLNNNILIVDGKIKIFYSILMVINNKKIILIKTLNYLDIKVLFFILLIEYIIVICYFITN